MKITKDLYLKSRRWFSRLSFRTGVFIACLCALCYIVSFAQMLLPISLEWKGALWVVFFGFAKATQYIAILILGKEGWKRMRNLLRRKRTSC